MKDVIRNSLIKIQEAYWFAYKKHEGQFRKFSKKPYITHPLSTAYLVAQITSDEDLVIAALLHDTIEDTNTTYYEINLKFGDNVMYLVKELTIDNINTQLTKKEYLAQAMNYMSSDALLIKLCDRLHNISSLNLTPKNFFNYYIGETKYILSNLTRKLEQEHIKLIDRINNRIKEMEDNYE